MKKKIKTFKQLQNEIKNLKARDRNIEMHIKGEINLGTRKVKSKKFYNRQKYKKNEYYISL